MHRLDSHQHYCCTGDRIAAREEQLRSWLKTEVGVKKLGQREKVIQAIGRLVTSAQTAAAGDAT